MGVAADKAKALVLLPDSQEGALEIKTEIELREEVIPADKPSARGEIGKKESDNNKKDKN